MLRTFIVFLLSGSVCLASDPSERSLYGIKLGMLQNNFCAMYPNTVEETEDHGSKLIVCTSQGADKVYGWFDGDRLIRIGFLFSPETLRRDGNPIAITRQLSEIVGSAAVRVKIDGGSMSYRSKGSVYVVDRWDAEGAKIIYGSKWSFVIKDLPKLPEPEEKKTESPQPEKPVVFRPVDSRAKQ